MAGKLDVLNTGAGHLKIVVPDNATEIDKVNYERVITDMLKRGYLLFVEHKGQHIKIDHYDSRTGEYILANYPLAHQAAEELQAGDVRKSASTSSGESAVQTSGTKAKAGKKGRPRLSANKANVTAIAKSAGG